MSNALTYGIIFFIYLLLMVGIGLFFFLKNKNVSDYVLGGRTLNPWAAALSAQASDMSGWLLMGLPGTAYVLFAGTTEAIWTAIGLAVGTYINWLIVAKRLRKYTKAAGDSITLPEFFTNRFGDKTGILKGVSAVMILIFFVFYVASMFQASAKLFKTVFGMPYEWALILGVAIIVAYTFLGGFLAVCWTDVIQGVLMFVALIITPIVAMNRLGGTEAIGAMISDLGVEFSLIPYTADGAVNVALLVSSIAWGLGYFGQPHILPRFMGIRKADEIRPARIIATVWVLITLAAAVIIGVLGRFMFPDLADPESIFINMSTSLYHPILAGIMLTAILAAIMSTADSQLLVTSSSVANDLYKGLIKKDASDKTILWLNRIAVIVVSVLAGALVFVENPAEGSVLARITESVFKLVSFAWAGFGAAFGPAVLFSLFWKKTTKWGVLAGIISGGVTACVWWLATGGIFDVYEIIPGFAVSCLAIVIVSLCTKNPEGIEEQFDTVKDYEL